MKHVVFAAIVIPVVVWAGPAVFAQATAQTHKPEHGAGAQHADDHAKHSDAKHADHMEHSFADVERYAKSFDNPARDAWQLPDRVIAALGLKAGETVADIGAGTGYFTVRLAKSPTAPKVFASDIEPNMVKHLQHRAMMEGLKNITAVIAKADSPNLPERVDVILIVDTYHHIPNRGAYFSLLKRSLKPGGRLAIIDFKKGSPEGPPEQFRFTPEQISGELTKAGYRLQTQHDFLPRQMFLIYTAG